MFFDTHAHYDDKAFNFDRDTLLQQELPEAGVSLVVNVGDSIKSSKLSVKLAEQYGFVCAAVGVHPNEVNHKRISSVDIDELGILATLPKVVAIGEIGLDYHYPETDKDNQRGAFVAQMALAKRMDKPVIIHDREAHGDVMDVIRQYPSVRGVFHCYSGSLEMARELLSMGWYISFTGVITYKNANKLLDVAAAIPNDRLLLETDAPYLSPEPIRGRRNDSTNLKYTAAALAQIRNVTVEEICSLTMENGKRLFGI